MVGPPTAEPKTPPPRDAEAAGARPLAVRTALRGLPRPEGGRPRSTRRAPSRSTDELHPRRLQAALHADRLDSDRPRSVHHPDPGRPWHADAPLEGVERGGALGARVSAQVALRAFPRGAARPSDHRADAPEGRPPAPRAGGRALRQAPLRPLPRRRRGRKRRRRPRLRANGRPAGAPPRFHEGPLHSRRGDGGSLPHAAYRTRRDADGRLRHPPRRRDLGCRRVRSLAGSRAPAARAAPGPHPRPGR